MSIHDIGTVWDRDWNGPDTRTVWDRDYDGPLTETLWDFSLPAIIGKLIQILPRGIVQLLARPTIEVTP